MNTNYTGRKIRKLPTVQAVDTEYAGEKFRSRLEARVAYFLDLLGIAWMYEPDAYELRDRLGFFPGEGDTATWTTPLRYLPDFWLPELGKFIEVKGVFRSEHDYKRFLSCAADLSEQGHNVILFSQVPKPSPEMRLPIELQFHEGTLYGSAWCPERGKITILYEPLDNVAYDHGGIDVPAALLLAGLGYDTPVSARVQGAFHMAKQARFDHGQTPKNVTPFPDPRRARTLSELREQFERQANPHEAFLWRQVPEHDRNAVLDRMSRPAPGRIIGGLLIDDYRARESFLEDFVARACHPSQVVG